MMKKKFMTGALVLLSSIVLAACGQEDGSDDSVGKNLNLRLKSFAISADPKMISSTESRRLADLIHARLFRAGEDGKPVAELAESWKWTSEKVLHITLKTGLKFTNGKAIDAKDVAFSLCRHLQAGSPYGWMFGNIAHTANKETKKTTCGGLKAVDDRSVEITVTDHPDRLLAALSASPAGIIPLNAKPGEFGKTPSAGPYAIDNIASNASISLKAHIGGPLKPGSDTIHFRLVSDDGEAASLFKRGELDVLEIDNPRLFRLVTNDKGELPNGGRMTQREVHQIRFLLVNIEALQKKLKLDKGQVAEFIHSLKAKAQKADFAGVYQQMGTPLTTAYFPARKTVKPVGGNVAPPQTAEAELKIITESDRYSDLIASKVPAKIGNASISYTGMDKGVMIGKIVKKQFDIASITLEAMVAADYYWLAFFNPGSPFTIFGASLEDLKTIEGSGHNATIARASTIDSKGNWIPLFQEKRAFAFRKGVGGEQYLPTGLLDYVGMTIGK